MWSNYANSRMLSGLCIVLVVVLVSAQASGRIISNTEVQDCVIGDYPLQCDTRQVVTVAVSHGLEATLEVMPDAGEAIRLELKKSVPTLTYPLKYFHTVNYYPYEKVVKVVDPNSDYSGCIACPNSLCPTCGWQRDDANNPIGDSQGFCSYKTLGEPTCSSWRGEELLGEHSSDANRFSTAHCLQQGELYYHGYEIGRYMRHYDIECKVTQGQNVQTIVIGPNDPVSAHWLLDDWYFRATLLGDFTETRGVPELDNYILYIPALPVSHPYVQNYPENMLLVPCEELSKDGSEFDKVGIDFYKFRMMGASVSVTEAGDGLHNQLYQKHQANLHQLMTNPGKDTSYLIKYMRPFQGSMDFESSSMPKALKYKIREIEYSQIQLTLEGSAVSQIETESDGRIAYGQVETFESLTNDGVLKVGIMNNGALKANYIVTVTDLTAGLIDAVPAQARTLDAIPFRVEEFAFDIHTKQNTGESHQLRVTLKSPTGRIYHTHDVIFDTTEHGTKYPRDLQMKNQGSEVGDTVVVTGDITCDGQVDYDDLALLASYWLEDGAFSDLAAWPHCDNLINNYDFSVLARSWMKGTL